MNSKEDFDDWFSSNVGVGKRFLKTNTDRTHTGNEQPLSKKPKLDIDKHISLSSSTSNSRNTRDIYDDIWGEDPDSTALEKFDFDETQALSQVIPKPVPTQSKAGFMVTQSNAFNYPHSSKIPQSFTNRGQINRHTITNDKAVHTKSMKNSPKVPLRRTASSGWPTTNSSSSHRESFMVARNSFGKWPNDVNSIQSDLEQLCIENENLKQEVTKKTGEVNLIRDRLNSLQQEYCKQNKDLTSKIHTTKQEAERNIARLSKEITSLKGQLDVKSMELDTVERRAQHLHSMNRLHPESPNDRLRNSIKSVLSPALDNNKQFQKDDHLMCGRSQMRSKVFTHSFDLLKQLITPELLQPSQPEASILESVRTISNPGLFSGPVGSIEAQISSGGHSSRSLFSRNSAMEVLPTMGRQLSDPCPSMEPCSLFLLSSHLLNITSDNANEIISKVLDSSVQILLDQRHQLDSAVDSQNRCVERERELVHCGFKYLKLTDNYNLLSSKELYNNERGICARRTLALLAMLVEISDFAAEKILPSSTSEQSNYKIKDDITEGPTNSGSSIVFDSHTMLNIVNDIVSQIDKQRRTLMFQGVLAGATALIKGLLQSDLTISQKSQEIIIHILRGVVFARPGSLVILNILHILLAATKYPEITYSICHNSMKKTFDESPHASMISFTEDSCILQILCIHLQLLETPKKHILSDVFTSWVLTLFYGSLHCPQWLFSVPSQRSCKCRPLISKLTFTLLGEACCIYPSVSADNNEKKSLETLLTRGILLVCTLLYHDDNFGVNVDPASVGYYELFLQFMNTCDMDIKLNKACREILENLCIQESLRQPIAASGGDDGELFSLVRSIYCTKNSRELEETLEDLDKY